MKPAGKVLLLAMLALLLALTETERKRERTEVFQLAESTKASWDPTCAACRRPAAAFTALCHPSLAAHLSTTLTIAMMDTSPHTPDAVSSTALRAKSDVVHCSFRGCQHLVALQPLLLLT